MTKPAMSEEERARRFRDAVEYHAPSMEALRETLAELLARGYVLGGKPTTATFTVLVKWKE